MGDQLTCSSIVKRILSNTCNITNCLGCNDTGYCQNCTYNFTAVSGYCVACPINCQSCDENKCSKCWPGYYINFGECWANSTNGYARGCADPNCYYCYDLNNCFDCLYEYFLNTTAHYCQSCNISGCLTCQDQTKC